MKKLKPIKSPETRTVQVSSLIITVPENYRRLEALFQLASYPLPADWAYGDIHITLHEQLTQAYRVWTYAQPPSVYVLWPLEQEPKPIQFGDQSVEPQMLNYDEIQFHVLIKLIMEDYFRGISQFFTGEGKRYRFVKWEKDNQSALCLQFDLSAAENVASDDPVQTFNVQAGTCRFICYPAERAQPGRYSYYHRNLGRDGSFNIQMLTRDEAKSRVQKGESVWGPYQNNERRARLDFFNEQSLETARGYVLWEFCHQFVQRLEEFGISAQPKTRTFVQYLAKKPKKDSALDLDLTGTVYHILDVRHQHSIPLDCYLGQFKEWFPACAFISIVESDIPTVTSGPIIVLMDATRDAYARILTSTAFKDPRQLLYQKYPEVPLQGFMVNPNPDDKDGTNPASYLDYSFWNENKMLKDFQLRADLTMRDALLKHVLLHGIPLEGILPDTPALGNYLYVLRHRHEGSRYTVFMQVQDGIVRLDHAMDIESRKALYAVCEGLGVSWDDVEDSILQRRIALKLKQTDFDFSVVIGQDCASEIVDVPEYALYEFGEIQNRVEERKIPRPVDFFQTLPHYDAYAAARGWPSLTEIESISPRDSSLMRTQQKARFLLERLQQHDDFLSELSRRVATISAQQLRMDDEYIAMLDAVGLTYHTVRDVWNAEGKLLNPRKKDVVFHSGIWFDASDQTYMVGSPDEIQQKQKNAHHLRRFEKRLQNGVDLEDMLQLTEVGFVRLNQYTVVPFPFKLLRLYIENYLSWKLK